MQPQMQPGSPLKGFNRGPLEAKELEAYASASGDYNPIHLNPMFAKEAGFESCIVHGMLSMAFMADLIELNFPSAKFQVKKFKTRFRKVTFPGETLKVQGEVKSITPEGDCVVSVWIENPKGETTTDGEACLKPVASA